MAQFKAKTLEEAFQKAATKFECSVTEIEFEILQHPKKGIFGLIGKKEAIVFAVSKKSEVSTSPEFSSDIKKEESRPLDKKYKQKESVKKPNINTQKADEKTVTPPPKQPEAQRKEATSEPKINYHKSEKNIIDNFYTQTEEKESIPSIVEKELNRLFADICFELEPIKVEQYDESTLYIEFSGKDSALLIGKEGYRYKALSYMLFNWINTKYGMMIRLEIAEFLQNQEEMIRNYLKPVIASINKDGRATTRPLDGVLVHIALKQLREEFPNKYVAIKINSDGERFIVINDFFKQQ